MTDWLKKTSLSMQNWYRRQRAAMLLLTPWFYWFLLFNLVLVQGISILYFSLTRSYPETLLAWLFLFFYSCGHFFSIVLILGAFWSLIVFMWPSLRLHRIALSFIFGFLIIILVIDALVYSQYRFHLNLLVLDMFFNAHGQVISFAWQSWVNMGALGLLIFGIEFFAAKIIAKHHTRFLGRNVGRRIFAFYFLSLVLAHGAHVAADAVFYAPITRMGMIFPFAVPAQAQSFLAAHGLVDVELYKKHNALKVSIAERQLNYPQKPIQCQLQGKKLNVLWVLVDALRADMLNDDVMPNAYALTKKSQFFTNHFSGSNTTRYGVFNMFYGLPGVYFDPALKARTSPVLMDEFQRQGYEFGIFGSAPLDKPEFDQTVFTKIPNLKIITAGEHDYARDQEITRSFNKFLDDRNPGKPFYGFLFYDACHGYGIDPTFKKKFYPLVSAVDYVSLNNEADPIPVKNSYKNSANFIDSLIGDVLKKLAEKHLEESTIILISSDHGQEFNDNHLNYWGHNSNFSEVQTHVPLLIYWPGRAPQKFDHRTIHYDLAPTFLQELFACQGDARDYSSGFDLFEKKSHPWLIMGRRDDFAIYRDNDIVVVKTNGDYEVLDHGYHPVPGAQLDGAAVLPALDELRRFY